MATVEALIDAIPGAEFVGETMLLGTILGTLCRGFVRTASAFYSRAG